MNYHRIVLGSIVNAKRTGAFSHTIEKYSEHRNDNRSDHIPYDPEFLFQKSSSSKASPKGAEQEALNGAFP